MEERKITAEEFDDAVRIAKDMVLHEHSDKALGVTLYTMSGITFAARLRDILFEEEQDNGVEL